MTFYHDLTDRANHRGGLSAQHFGDVAARIGADGSGGA
jgi:hypothetical protein